MLDDPSIRAELRQVLLHLAGRADGFGDDDDLLAVGVVSSLQVLELASYLEVHYRLSLEPEDVILGRLNSVSSITALVVERAGELG